MDFTTMKRDDNLKSDILVKDGDIIKAKDDFSIVFPSRFMDVGLATMGRTLDVVGIYAFVKDDRYYVGKMPVQVSMLPSIITDIQIGGKVYKELIFKKGQQVYADRNFIPNQELVYIMLEEFAIKSNNIPDYVGYEDLINIFITGSELTGAEIGSSIIDIAVFTSIITRDKDNNYIRENHSRKQIIAMKKLTYVGLTNFNKGLKNVASLISGGAYLQEGITSALTFDNPPVTEMGKTMSK